MNYKVILNIIGKILVLLALLMCLPLVVSFVYVEGIMLILSFLAPIFSCLLLGFLLVFFGNTKSKKIGIREGLIIVGLSWILMSLFGALPFIISGEIKSPITAFFEITSGFTTTGASALTADELDNMSHSLLFWRSFSHWIGGMGILVFILGIIPESKEGSAVHILRAESPGPTVGRLVSKMQVTARILYLIYMILSVLEFIILAVIFKTDGIETSGIFEAFIYTFGTAGTGGFGSTSAGFMGTYSIAAEYTVAIFMFIFGINFTMFYFLLIKNYKEVLCNEELRWYIITVFVSTTLICMNVYYLYNNLEQTFRYSFFTVASIISTTGFANVDYNSWPVMSLIIVCILSLTGACAGSTAGGMKMSRVLIISKYTRVKITSSISPRKVNMLFLDGKPVNEKIIDSVLSFVIIYFVVLISCTFLISIYNPGMDLDVLSGFTASLACVSNIGPGLGLVGPAGSYSNFSGFSKIVLSLEMIAGRLELFPILILFSVNTWKKRI